MGQKVNEAEVASVIMERGIHEARRRWSRHVVNRVASKVGVDHRLAKKWNKEFDHLLYDRSLRVADICAKADVCHNLVSRRIKELGIKRPRAKTPQREALDALPRGSFQELTTHEIAIRTGATTHTVRSYCREKGITLPNIADKSTLRSDLVRAAVRGMISVHKKTIGRNAEIAKILGVSRQRVNQLIDVVCSMSERDTNGEP